MATVNAARSSPKVPIARGGGNTLCVTHGTYEHATNLAATVIEYCRIPAGSILIGGWWGGDDLEAGAGDELNITIGWGATSSYVADPDGLGDLGVLSGAVSAHLGAVGMWLPFQGLLLTTGPLTFTDETALTATIVTDAEDTGTGTTTMVAYYITP